MAHIDTSIVKEAIAIQAEFLENRDRSGGDSTYDSRSPDEKARAKVALEKFRLIGRTAAFFGGYEGMLALNDAIVTGGGDSAWTNRMWEGIAGWLP